MAKTTRRWPAITVLAALLAPNPAGATCVPQSSIRLGHQDEQARVRTDDAALVALVDRGTAESATFRRLLQAIDNTDGVVYLERGRCGHWVQACLAMWLAASGPHRVLRVVMDARKGDESGIASLGHELQHALEVLSEPGVRSASEMYFFYSRNRAKRGDAFETDAAVETGSAVAKELKNCRHRRP